MKKNTFRKQGSWSQNVTNWVTSKTVTMDEANEYRVGYSQGYADAQAVYQRQLQNVEYLYRKEMGRKKK